MQQQEAERQMQHQQEERQMQQQEERQMQQQEDRQTQKASRQRNQQQQQKQGQGQQQQLDVKKIDQELVAQEWEQQHHQEQGGGATYSGQFAYFYPSNGSPPSVLLLGEDTYLNVTRQFLGFH